MAYTREYLLSVNSNIELNQCTKDNIDSLGLCYKSTKRFRGRRSGTRVNKSVLHSNDIVFDSKSHPEIDSIQLRVTCRPNDQLAFKLENRQNCLGRNLVDISNVRSKKDNITFCLLNCRSVNKKELQIRDYIIDNDIDCVCLTETWLRNECSDFSAGQITPTGYVFVHKPRLLGRGGGVAFLAKKNIKSKVLPLPDTRTFECLNLQVTLKNTNFYHIQAPT